MELGLGTRTLHLFPGKAGEKGALGSEQERPHQTAATRHSLPGRTTFDRLSNGVEATAQGRRIFDEVQP